MRFERRTEQCQNSLPTQPKIISFVRMVNRNVHFFYRKLCLFIRVVNIFHSTVGIISPSILQLMQCHTFLPIGYTNTSG